MPKMWKNKELLLVSVSLLLASDGDHEDTVRGHDVRGVVDVPVLLGDGRGHAAVHISQAGVASSTSWEENRLEPTVTSNYCEGSNGADKWCSGRNM